MKRACLLATALACAWTHGALADSRVVIRSFTGPGAEAVRDAAVQAAAEGDGVQLVTNKEVDASAASVSADVTTDAGRVAVARDLAIAAFVEGEVEKQGATTQVTLRVYEGRDGGLLGDVAIRAQNAAIAREVQRRFMPELGSAIRQARPPAPLEPLPPPPVAAAAPPPAAVVEKPQPAAQPTVVAAPKPRQPPAPPAAEPESQERTEPSRHALELGAGLLAITRSFAYRDALLKLPEHTGAATPALRLEARWYPGAHAGAGFLSNLGVEANAQVLWPSDAKQGNTSFTTTGTELGIAARARFPVSQHEVGLVAGYGVHNLAVGAANGQESGVPEVNYGFVRLGADGRLQLHRILSLDLRLAYLALTSFGQLDDRAWFSHVSGGGLDGLLSLCFDVNENVGLNVSGGTTRYFMSLHPSPADPGVSQGRIAGGITDQYVYGMIGVRVRPD